MSGRLFAVMAGLLGREPTGARARRHCSLSLLPLSLNLLLELSFLLLHIFGRVFCAQAPPFAGVCFFWCYVAFMLRRRWCTASPPLEPKLTEMATCMCCIHECSCRSPEGASWYQVDAPLPSSCDNSLLTPSPSPRPVLPPFPSFPHRWA